MNKIILSFLLGLAVLMAACSDDETPAAAPEVKRVTPSAAQPGAAVRISGAGFLATARDNIVAFNGTVAEVQEVQGDTLLKVTVPAGATTGPVTVANRSTWGSGPVFTMLAAGDPVVLTALSTTVAEPGETITISGAGFDYLAPADNRVYVGDMMASVVKATATALTFTLPVRIAAGQYDVTVTLRGAVSRALRLTVTAIPFVAGWFANTLINVGRDGLPQYVVTLTNESRYATATIPDDTLATFESLKYPVAHRWGYAFPAAYVASEKNMYMVNTMTNVLMRIHRGWTGSDFTELYRGADLGIDLNTSTAMGVQASTGEVFLAYTNASGESVVSRVNKDGSGLTTIAAYPYYSAVHDLCVSDRYIYVQEGVNGSASALRRIALGDGTVTDYDLSPFKPRAGIITAAFSTHNHTLYFVFDTGANWGDPNPLYALNEDTGSIIEVSRTLPVDVVASKILNTATGSYLFLVRGIFVNNAYTYALYMLNLKTDMGLMQPLYADMQIIPGLTASVIPRSYETQFYPHTLFLDEQ